MGFTGNFSTICELAKILGCKYAQTYIPVVGMSTATHQILKPYKALIVHVLHAFTLAHTTNIYGWYVKCSSVHLSGMHAQFTIHHKKIVL